MYWTKRNRLTAVIGLAWALSGCGIAMTGPILETDGREMIDIYRHAMDEGDSVDSKLGHSENGISATRSDEEMAERVRNIKPTQEERRLHKRYREIDGKYYSLRTGREITGFRCGTGRQQAKPCGSGYGFGRDITPDPDPDPEQTVPIADVEKSTTIESLQKKGPDKPDPGSVEAAFAEQERLRVEKARAQAASTQAAEQRQTRACTDGSLYCGFSRTPQNELQQLFPRLANPDIVVYITPHLATHNRVPIPGYTTAFPLYDEVHYAMPGEQVAP